MRQFGRQLELRKEKYGTELHQDVAQAQFDVARQKYFLGKYQDALADSEKNLGNFLRFWINFILTLLWFQFSKPNEYMVKDYYTPVISIWQPDLILKSIFPYYLIYIPMEFIL